MNRERQLAVIKSLGAAFSVAAVALRLGITIRGARYRVRRWLRDGLIADAGVAMRRQFALHRAFGRCSYYRTRTYRVYRPRTREGVGSVKCPPGSVCRASLSVTDSGPMLSR
jgi:hypothetical protein